MQHKRTHSLIGLSLIALAFAALPLLARADNITIQGGDQPPSQNIVVGLPGGTNAVNSTTPEGVAGMVANLYDFAILIGGLLAFGSILYGGILYLTTGGNPSAQHEAKERIRDAIIGLLLLLGIYLVLNLINPDLTKLRFPTLLKLTPPATEAVVTPLSIGTIPPNADVYACQPKGGGQIIGCYATQDDCVKSGCDVSASTTDTLAGTVTYNGSQECAQVKGAVCNASRATGHLSCEYHQSSGQLICRDANGNPIVSGTGYSGAGWDRNNPNAQCVANLGPIPQGAYAMGAAYDTADHGPEVIPLSPINNTNTCGRSGFLIHGDNSTHTASQGCIIMDKSVRDVIAKTGGGTLQVLQ